MAFMSATRPGLAIARPYQQHGLSSLKRRVKIRGLAGIEMRSAAVRALMAWRREIEAEWLGRRRSRPSSARWWT